MLPAETLSLSASSSASLWYGNRTTTLPPITKQSKALMGDDDDGVGGGEGEKNEEAEACATREEGFEFVLGHIPTSLQLGCYAVGTRDT